ncbi:unnamed protein product [Lepeophtheirus salmonis]|uniref:(salmon louse) hypothetical protein n=1 Tax=Lepeophtheirus salmonis TaxID=72036 RepID=A0A7R8D8V5_LEPSM|nr:unnamed protein product [Lepeophtheirus salmonis]CAF3038038.1 unnamed protein product [Lepeophtheirus salmonis]
MASTRLGSMRRRKGIKESRKERRINHYITEGEGEKYDIGTVLERLAGVKSSTKTDTVKIGNWNNVLILQYAKWTLRERGSKPNSLQKKKSKIRRKEPSTQEECKALDRGEYNIQRMDNKKEFLDLLLNGLPAASAGVGIEYRMLSF